MQYYVAVNGERKGPMDVETIKAMPGFAPDTLLWSEGTNEWVTAQTLPEFAGYFQPAPPPQNPIDAQKPQGVESNLNNAQGECQSGTKANSAKKTATWALWLSVYSFIAPLLLVTGSLITAFPIGLVVLSQSSWLTFGIGIWLTIKGYRKNEANFNKCITAACFLIATLTFWIIIILIAKIK